jgi:hypothetical protein
MTKYLYFCVDEDGTECVFADIKPKRSEKGMQCLRYWYSTKVGAMVLPKGSIRHITGVILTWSDNYFKWSPNQSTQPTTPSQ